MEGPEGETNDIWGWMILTIFLVRQFEHVDINLKREMVCFALSLVNMKQGEALLFSLEEQMEDEDEDEVGRYWTRRRADIEVLRSSLADERMFDIDDQYNVRQSSRLYV